MSKAVQKLKDIVKYEASTRHIGGLRKLKIWETIKHGDTERNIEVMVRTAERVGAFIGHHAYNALDILLIYTTYLNLCEEDWQRAQASLAAIGIVEVAKFITYYGTDYVMSNMMGELPPINPNQVGH
ncbi:hypothetical protein HYX05_02035 [Candidatus Woesearchaeota archaeon]|nr:hypothetical protein [Candidatus Woesearchaeota archaeon]